MHAAPAHRAANQGFSLLEVLIALSITALVSALIFSSLATQMTQADLVRRSTFQAFEGLTGRRLAGLVVSRTLPAWSEEVQSRFSGSPEAMSGLTAADLFGPWEGIRNYELRLMPEGEGRRLYVALNGATWPTLTFPPGARFRYLGPSGRWHTHWPPPGREPEGLAELETYLMDTGLPVLVAVWDEGNDRFVGLEIRFDNSAALPARVRDLVGDDPL